MKTLGRAKRTYRNGTHVFTEYGTVVEKNGVKYFVEDAKPEDLDDWAQVERDYCFYELEDDTSWTYID